MSNSNNPTKEIWIGPTGQYLDQLNPRPDQSGPNTPNELLNNINTITTTINPFSHSILPASGFPLYSNFQIAMASGSFPEVLSSARWSDENKGYPQQTFLGASIRSFSMQGGFGDNSASLNVDLVVDEYNPSDRTPAGQGDDVYHSGSILVPDGMGGQKSIGDNFVPPIPGSPVFFKFGPNHATVEEAYRKTFDELYNFNTMVDTQPASAGSTTLENILNGTVNIPPDHYVDLYIQDYGTDEGEILSIPKQNQGRYIFNYRPIRTNPLSRGKDHIVFGGILQTYTQNRSPAGNPLYTVGVVDPREILSNVTLILNNYAGPTYEQKNVMNLYGFLEYNPTEQTKSYIKSLMRYENTLKKKVEVIQQNKLGEITLSGDDKYYKREPLPLTDLKTIIKDTIKAIAEEKRKISNYRITNDFIGAERSYQRMINLHQTVKATKIELERQTRLSLPFFPMTGTGFARRGSQGIPYYRVKDAINALMEYQTPLPQEYKDQGFGGRINFRGFNYIVDFGGLPELPEFYYIDFDQINLLELALEICDITNRDLYVSLLPVIDHPACSNLYNYNINLSLNLSNTSPDATVRDMVAGIIRLDTIDRSEQPFYGAIKTYIDSLAANKIYVENQDLGYELSNVVTDKFIVGAQEIDMYYFSTNADRDYLAFRKTGRNGVFPNKPTGYEWTLEASLEQQVLPYYGKLGNNAVTIPKGFGAYQQILLDSSSLNAAGVGAYYVATEMELRCALISFDRWKEFLQTYNDIYMESIESDDAADASIAGLTPTPIGQNPPPLNISSNYAVTVPRSVFDTYILPSGQFYDADGLPKSACNPPYGYPLYYKRMTRIGIPEGGLTNLFTKWTTLNTNLAQLQSADRKNISGIINSQYQALKQVQESQGLTQFEKDYYTELERLLQNPNPLAIDRSIGLLENIVKGNGRNMFAILPNIAKKNTKNAMKVYEFVKAVAEECLGKKFLVKIPREVNLYYANEIKWSDPTIQEYIQGPFGFRPRSTKNIAYTFTPAFGHEARPAQTYGGYESTPQFAAQLTQERTIFPPRINIMQSFLSSGVLPNPTSFGGALRVNYNPISEKYESNYTPMNIGGYFPFDLYQNTLGASTIKDMSTINFNSLPSGVKQGLIPQDLTNFINEDGRVSPYVRFDNAEDLTLEGLNNSDFTQQYIVGNAMIPDLMEGLDNTGPDQFHSFPNIDQEQNNNTAPKPKQLAFVKCSVDEQLYFPPRFVTRKIPVHGQFVKDIGMKSLPQKIFIPCSGIENNRFVEGSGIYVDSWAFYKANFVPLPREGAKVDILDFERYNPFIDIPGGDRLNNSEYVNTDFDKLNTEHVYALITLPNRILPNKDSRHRDGHFQSMSAEKFKHIMTMDVVRGLPGFELPTNPLTRPPDGNLKAEFEKHITLDNRIKAWFAMKKIHASMSFGFPQQINITMPSPVYPDLIALPLMSNDRCYGPWISSQLDGQAYLLKNIGGKVDFVKDENLSPWNYGGYHLMNEAGRLQAEFSNSLLLFSERGSFTVPSIPQGNLCKALIEGGPLVTSINVDVSDNGLRTTYQMDLYTASFGKLQKQKQEEISKISRERKKLISERNALIRKGLGKNQSARNFNIEYNMMSQGTMPGLDQMGLGMANAMNSLVVSTNVSPANRWSSNLAQFGNNGNGSPASLTVNEYSTGGSLQNATQIGKTAQLHIDQFSLARDYQNSAERPLFGDGSENPMFAGISHGYHANLPYIPNYADNSYLYFLDDPESDFSDQITKNGDMA